MNSCKFCGLKIFWRNNNDKWLQFEDKAGSSQHKCIEYQKGKEYQIYDDHKLLAKTITRVSELEKSATKIESILNGVT